MKAKDLMIGDWVDIRLEEDLEDEHMYSQVEQLWECEIDADFQTGYENVYPIPLTEEILEKNGFTSVEDPYNHKKYFLLGKNEYNYDVYWDGLAILLVEEDYEPTTYAYICDVEYVHELQHALKLCKFEKEIIV